MASSVKISNANGKIVTIENNDSNMSDVTLNGASITKKVDTLANMRAMGELPETVWCSGYHSENDGAFGSHFFRLKGLKTTETDNSGTVIIVSVGGSDYAYELQFDGAVNVKWFGAKGDGITDDTVILQNVIDNFMSIEFAGVCAVSTLAFNTSGGYYSGKPSFKGIANAATDAVIEITGYGLHFDALNVNQNFNLNYVSAVKWHSLATITPSQFVKIEEMYMNNCIIGLLYGQLNGVTTIDAPQSENIITRLHTRGCQIPIYYNQPNGFLMISSSSLNSIRNEWEIVSPGSYVYADARCITMYNGLLNIVNTEILKVDTQLGYGIEQNGGTLLIGSCTTEIASTNYYNTAGDCLIENMSSYFSNASAPFIELTHTTDGVLSISNSHIKKPASATNANTAFILHNDNNIFEVNISNVTLDNQFTYAAFKGASAAYISKNTSINNLTINDGGATRSNMKIGSNQNNNLLPAKGVNNYATTLDGWYYRLSYGGGTTLTVVADAPAANVKEKTMTSAIQLYATGAAILTTIDTTSLATIKETGVPVTVGSTILISGWVKASTGTAQQEFGIHGCNATGTTTDLFKVGISTAVIDTTWKYFEVPIKITDTNMAFIGIGIRAIVSTVLITDAKLSVLE